MDWSFIFSCFSFYFPKFIVFLFSLLRNFINFVFHYFIVAVIFFLISKSWFLFLAVLLFMVSCHCFFSDYSENINYISCLMKLFSAPWVMFVSSEDLCAYSFFFFALFGLILSIQRTLVLFKYAGPEVCGVVWWVRWAYLGSSGWKSRTCNLGHVYRIIAVCK